MSCLWCQGNRTYIVSSRKPSTASRPSKPKPNTHKTDKIPETSEDANPATITYTEPLTATQNPTTNPEVTSLPAKPYNEINGHIDNITHENTNGNVVSEESVTTPTKIKNTNIKEEETVEIQKINDHVVSSEISSVAESSTTETTLDVEVKTEIKSEKPIEVNKVAGSSSTSCLIEESAKPNVTCIETTNVKQKSAEDEEQRTVSIVVDKVEVIENEPPSDDHHEDNLLDIPQTSRKSSVESGRSSSDERKDTIQTVLKPGYSTAESNRRRSGVQDSMPKYIEGSTPVYGKSPEDIEKIKNAIEKNEFLSKIISGNRLTDIINAMQVKKFDAKTKIIKQGDTGSEMYVSKEGKFRTLIKGKVVGEFSDIRVFGELAILYNAKRLAAIQAVTECVVWVLRRDVYKQIVVNDNIKEQDDNLRFLRSVAYLNVVEDQVLRQVANLLKPEFFAPSSVIIRQGDKGDKFYIIRAGTVTISKTGEGVLGKLGKGQCFGEMALQKEDTRQATVIAEAPGVECLTLTRSNFNAHFEPVEIPKLQVKRTSFVDKAEAEYQDIKLSDFKIAATLGVGGFGRVELVQNKKKKNLVFALKYLKKVNIVRMQQQEHVYNEKIIQMNCKSPFIVRLYRTYKDAKYVYFLMEACLGGDLFSLIHKQKNKRFDEKDTRFYSGCVVEALEYLHSRGIIYRDLKPENLLVDKIGYLKLTDFGFAKRMPARGKTFTFAGTPEYVAPEIVLNRGHDKSVDYWALGVLVYELLTGRTPFKTGDSTHMRTYNKILNGIINFPSYVSPKARNLVEKLCKPFSLERLGMQKSGTRDIKLHKWYQDFDWVKFGQRQISAPHKPKIKDILDTSLFDDFRQDKDIPPDELTGWDINF